MNSISSDTNRPVSAPQNEVHEGRCTCEHVRYRVAGAPLIVHACHCSVCQIQTGAAYVINALFEDHRVEVVSGTLEQVRVATPSGSGQTVFRCPRCWVAVWSKYHMLPRVGHRILFVRVGTLTVPDRCPPDVHIHTVSQQAHVQLPVDARVFENSYRYSEVWPPNSLERAALLADPP